MTLHIRDKALREKFQDIELTAVKRRWEICTAIFFAAMLFVAILGFNDWDQLTRFYIQMGDIAISLSLMAILGRKCKKAHHYSVFVLIFLRAVWTILQV